MNRIILIGNGFDLAHGLKTSYRDFIDWFWEKETEYFSNQDNYVFCENKPKYDFEDLICDFRKQNFWLAYDNFIVNTVTDVLIKKFDENNIINRFLLQIKNKQDIQNWVDFENEYYDALKSLIIDDFKLPNDICYPSFDFEYAINSMKGKLSNEERTIRPIDYLNNCFNQIKIEFEKYLTQATENAPYQEKKIKNLIYKDFNYKDFTIGGINQLIKEKYDDFRKECEEESENAEILHQKISEEINDEFIEDEEQYFKREILAGRIKPLPPAQYLFLDFNYTNTSSKYVQERRYADKYEIIHIHGELNNLKNPIIFGYGDELDDDYKTILKKNDNAFLENIKSVKYAETYNYKKLLNFIESDNYQIFVMGHSCGNSDRTLLNKLFEHKNCQSIKIFYHQYKEKDKDGNDIIKDNFSDVYRNIMRNFTNFSELRAKVVDKTNSTPLPQIKSY